MDNSFRTFLDSASQFLIDSKIARDNENKTKSERLMIASLLFAWIAIELFISNMMVDFIQTESDKFENHEIAFMQEKKLDFISSGTDSGLFQISKKDNYQRLEDKILYLTRKLSKEPIDRSSNVWVKFKEFKKVRDSITHPNKEIKIDLTIEKVESYLQNSKDIISLVSEKVWKKTIVF